jgi:hypothetical protein
MTFGDGKQQKKRKKSIVGYKQKHTDRNTKKVKSQKDDKRYKVASGDGVTDATGASSAVSTASAVSTPRHRVNRFAGGNGGMPFDMGSSPDPDAKVLTDLALRMCIARWFVDVLGMPPESDWGRCSDGHGLGTIGQILKDQQIPTGSRETVRKVLEDVTFCHANGATYAGERRSGSGGTNVKIADGSPELQIIADAMEGGWGLRNTRRLVNNWRQEQVPSRPKIGRSAVHSAVLRLTPDTTAIGHMKQGSFSKDATWSKARFGWVTQLLICFSVLSLTFTGLQELGFVAAALTVPAAAADMVIPAAFDAAQLTQFDLYHVAFWDETHRKVRVGNFSLSGVQYRFLRDESGKLDPKGKLCPQGHELKMKYAGEVRLCLGVAVRQDPVTKTKTGVRLPAFDYTSKTVLTIKDFQVQRDKEIARVKSKDGGKWSGSKRPKKTAADFVLYEDDHVGKLDGISETGGPAKKMQADDGITTVKGLVIAALTNSRYKKHAEAAKKANGGYGPKPGAYVRSGNVHSAEENPYASLHGTEVMPSGKLKWQEAIDKVAGMSKFVCVTDLVKHIHDGQCCCCLVCSIY